MAFKQFPLLGGGTGAGNGGGGGGGGSDLSFPLSGPPGSPGSITYGFTTGGGLYGTNDGGLRFATSQVADVIKIDPSGLATFTKQLMVQGLATLAGGLATTTVSAASATLSGNASVGGSLGVSGSVQVTGDVSARKVTASGDLSAASLSTPGAIAGATLSLIGKATVGALDVKGTFKVSQIESDGPLYFPAASTNLPGLALGDEHGTGLFAAQGGTIGLSSDGRVAFSIAHNLAATFAGDVTVQGLTAGAAVLSSLTVANPVTLGDVSVAKLTASGVVAFASDLTVQGTTRLANLVIDHISTDHDLTVGGNAQVQGTLNVAGQSSLAGLSVSGATALGTFSAGAGVITGLRIVGGDANYPPVEQVPNPNGVGTTPYVFVLGADGALSTSGRLKTLRQAEVGTTLTVGGAATAASFTASGEVRAGSQLRAPVSVIGGSTFATTHGSPNGQLTGSVGDQAIDLDSGAYYLKLSGNASSAGWVAVTTQATASTFPLLAGTSADASHPQYAYSADSRTGFGLLANGNLFLSQAGQAALQITPSGSTVLSGLSVAGPTSLGGTLLVGGASQLASLVAGDTQVNALTASAAYINGSLGASTALFGGLTVSGAAHVVGALNVDAAVSSAASVAAPLLITGTSVLRAGNGNPNGSVTGNLGDRYVQQDVGALWIKVTGTDNQGWAKVSTSASGVTYPLTAPDGQLVSPSLGFAQGGLGITANGSQVLVAVTNGTVGWRLDATQNFSLTAALTVAGASTLQGLSAQAITAASANLSGSLSVNGTSVLQALTATSAQVASLAASAAVTASTVSATGAISGGTIASGSNTWRSLTAAPANTVGADGDITSLSQGSVALLVRVAGTWRQVALTGDAAPTQFPLRGPADSAAAPNFAPSAASPGSGMYSPGLNQLGFSTNGLPAATIDASQKWTFAAAIAAGVGTFTQVTTTGGLSVAGNASFGGTFQVTGAATLTSTLSSGAITSSGQVSGASLTASGSMSGQSLTTAGDATIGGNLTVNGVTTYNGVQRTGSLTLGDGTVGSPSLAFTSELALGAYRPSAGVLAFAVGGAQSLALAAALATFAGAVRVGGTNAGILSPAANTLALQTAGNTSLSIAASGVATFAFQTLFPAGTASLPSVAVAQANSGVWAGSDSASNPALAISVAGKPSAIFKTLTVNSLPVYTLGLGDLASATVNGGILATAQDPTNTITGYPGQIAQWLGGGAGKSLFVYEGTSVGTSGWSPVLTASGGAAPSYPLRSTTLGSAASPAFGFGVTGYTTTGVFAAPDAGTGNIPTLAMAANGQSIGYFEYGTANSIPVYTMCLGSPAVSASPYNGALRASAQAALGNIIAAPGQLAINNVGGPGTILAVKESGVGNTSGWALLYTQGSTQIAGQSGSVAAPYHSFANSLSSGFSYSSGSGVTTSVAGTQVFNIGTVGALFSNSWVQFPSGSSTQPSVCFSNNPTSGFYSGTAFSNPSIYVSLGASYWGGFVKFSGGFGCGIDVGTTGNFANGGIIFGTVLPNGNNTTSPGTLVLYSGGGAGTTAWLKESGSLTSTGYAAILTTTSQLAAGKFAYQASGPSAITSVGQIYTLSSDGNLYYISAAGKVTNLSGAATQPASNTAPAATYTTVAGDANRQFVNTGTSQSAITLYTVPTGVDYAVTFVVGGTGGFSITAPSNQIIYVGSTPTTQSNITSSTPGSVITLSNPGGLGTWYAQSVVGQWTAN